MEFSGQPIVTVKSAAFKRCLANLVTNAARYAHSISITGHRDHRWLTITIDDDGPGIPPADAGECSNPSFGSTTRAIRTRAGPDWGLPLPATSPVLMAATSCWAIHRLVAFAPPCACRCNLDNRVIKKAPALTGGFCIHEKRLRAEPQRPDQHTAACLPIPWSRAITTPTGRSRVIPLAGNPTAVMVAAVAVPFAAVVTTVMRTMCLCHCPWCLLP